MPLRMLLLAFSILVLGTRPVLAEEKPSSPLVDDLMVLAAVLPVYKVKNASPEEAMMEIWKVALGREPIHIRFKMAEPHWEQQSNISLDLRNVPVPEVLRYIQELSGSIRWDIQGRDPEVMELKLEPVTVLDHSEFVLHSVAYSLSASGAARLGLREGMTSPEILTLLAKYGCYTDHSGAAAYWSPQTKMLAVRLWRADVTLVGSLTHLVNKGFRLVKE